ncbi:MAG: hypothetical protein AVDCRST_MAG72-2700 [uncultured Nocardioidaceae bacterium]|uniref:Uncharacterized protein n=1 Tax=uncultured Nocardioidaceae bacterium TaxID=253824 RepID=A0A6J4MQ48_9ACTN|nr:MAG: hypothetical protein AVDCRST_MAG72-2700 [uncultured Nocardioidaceae bacterium]
MSVLVELTPHSASRSVRTPAHRAAASVTRTGVTAVLSLALVLAVTGSVTMVFGALAGGGALMLASAAALVLRRDRRARSWQRELEAACGVHERRTLNLRRVL